MKNCTTKDFFRKDATRESFARRLLAFDTMRDLYAHLLNHTEERTNFAILVELFTVCAESDEFERMKKAVNPDTERGKSVILSAVECAFDSGWRRGGTSDEKIRFAHEAMKQEKRRIVSVLANIGNLFAGKDKI